VDGQDPRQLLAQRLRALREARWPGQKITQPQLAQALGGGKPLSVPLISSWESQTNPRIPPLSRLEGYAALFATSRSFEGGEPRLLSPEDMSDEERQAMTELWQELTHLRADALRAESTPETEPAVLSDVERSLRAGPWCFPGGKDITIVCAQWPPEMLRQIPYTDVSDPDYIELLTVPDLDPLFELYGHLRAANPANQVNLRIAGRLSADDYTSHLVSLGGVDWNTITSNALNRLSLPVRQVADWATPGEQYFEVTENGATDKHRPKVLDVSGNPKGILTEDVALFARAVSPFNRKRTVTICNGMYGRGTYGVVRALTDARFRDRNADYLRSRFGSSDTFCILSRVPIVDGATLTPDWTTGDYTLFEWSG
jgi:transcriptional regulator with XRE-family HTH domain